MKETKTEIGAKSSKIEKPGMIWCRRPEPIEGCSGRRGGGGLTFSVQI